MMAEAAVPGRTNRYGRLAFDHLLAASCLLALAQNMLGVEYTDLAATSVRRDACLVRINSCWVPSRLPGSQPAGSAPVDTDVQDFWRHRSNADIDDFEKCADRASSFCLLLEFPVPTLAV